MNGRFRAFRVLIDRRKLHKSGQVLRDLQPCEPFSGLGVIQDNRQVQA